MRDHCNGERSLEAVLLARQGLVAAVRSTRDWPTEGLRVFVEEDRRREEVVLLRGKAVLHSMKPPERGGRINAGKGKKKGRAELQRLAGNVSINPTRHVVLCC
jgi:hypothetical protein